MIANLAPRLLHTLANATRGKYVREFALAAADPERAQRAKLAELMARNEGTEYGRAHGFSKIRTLRDYASVPIMTPADLQPLVRRQMEGARNLLTADAPVYYVRTTGSTGEPKHVPITHSYRAEFQRTVHVSLFNLRRRFPEAFHSRALYFVGSRKVARAPDGNDVGTMSGFNFTEMPKLVRAVYAWPYELFEVQDLRARSFLALLCASLGDPSLIAGIFPAPIVYLLRDLSAQAGELARTLRDGVLPPLQLSPEQRTFFSARLGGPRRALSQRLERAAAAPESEQVALAWPSLRLVYCWITATAALYLPELRRRLGTGIAVRDAIYSACEGWCSIPMGDEEPGGALAVTSHFFEFIEEGAFASGSRETLGAAQLEDKKRYVILLTTAAGLYRYLLGDVIEVCGFEQRAPRIRFVRKLGAASNLAGEKLDESHVNGAVAKALGEAGLEATFFTLAPLVGGERPGYALLIELAGAAGVERLEAVRARIDSALGEESYDYGRLRGGGQLNALVVRPLAQGTYARVRQAKVQDGSAEAQLKTAHLVGDVASLAPELRAAVALASS